MKTKYLRCINYKYVIKDANLVEKIFLQILILLPLFFSFPLAEPYRLFQSYIPLEKCNIYNTVIETSRERKGEITLKTVKHNIERDYRVSLSIGSWIKEPQNINNTKVAIYECPYLNWFPLIAQVEINGNIYFKYMGIDEFNETSQSYKISFFFIMPASLVIYLLFLLYLNKKQFRNRKKY